MFSDVELERQAKVSIPRKYQQEAIDASMNFFLRDRRMKSALIVAPTGSGKSVTIAHVAENLPNKVLVLQPQKEILEQNYRKFTEMGGHAGIFSASAGRKDTSRVTFATIGTVINNVSLFSDIRQIIVDECHLGATDEGRMNTFFKMLDNPKILGLTATPFRMYPTMGGSMLKMLTRTRPKIYDEIIHWTQIMDIKQQGFLADLQYYRMCKGFDRRKIKINSSGSDFDEDALRDYYRSIDFLHEITDVVERINKVGRNVLCFTNFVSDAHDLSDIMNGKGMTTAVVSGKTHAKERGQIISDFKSGRIRNVVNVGTLTTGFDHPELNSIVIARPMRSLSLWYQMVGRGMRPHPSKENCWVVDLCGNYEVFGPVENLRIEFDKGKINLPSIYGKHGKLTGVLLHKDEDVVKEYEANWGRFA